MKRRKIYYIPGMISLILLPILCVWYLNEHKNIQRCIEVTYASKYDPKDVTPIKLDTSILSQPSEIRHYHNFYLTGDLKFDSIQELKFRFNAKQIIETNDTLNGIHVIFGDNINYNLYIKTIDFFYRNMKTYNSTKIFYNYNTNLLLFENHIWFLNKRYQKPKKSDFECQIQCLTVDYKPNFNEQLQDWINNLKISIKLWPFFLVFIGFSIISIRYIKNNQTQQYERFN